VINKLVSSANKTNYSPYLMEDNLYILKTNEQELGLAVLHVSFPFKKKCIYSV
jgi:hypothetical protein